ncbi:hypothetical protein NOR_07274 [Metarhizium rileyi]|uniref:Uncharacterized protein n=1 Tax=Metarhizium rileyi (strain RCEF 4871) TaxID=1649241 RepID=A0A166YKB0_METRR|nr:hypothetical protein NOR_07274 [Metarhizium rileyi RCEF 4871]
MAPQQLHAHHPLRPGSGRTDGSWSRQPLTRLTINTIGRHPKGVCKSKSAKSSKNPTPIYRDGSRTDPRRKILKHQIESARQVFTRLPRKLSNRTPRLPSDDGQHELQYPGYMFWRLVSLPFLTKKELRRLRDDLIDAVGELYKAHVAFIFDLASFSVVKKMRNTPTHVFVPFLDTFDFDKRPDDSAISWKDLEKEQVSIVQAHFDVLELIAELSETSALSEPPQLRPDLQPDIVAKVVEEYGLRDDHRNRVICSISTYSSELASLVIRHACSCARRLPLRTRLAEMSTDKSIRSHCSAISHVLGLLDQHMRDGQALPHRAALLVVHAVLLIQLHAKSIGVMHSQGILEMNGDDTPDAYRSYEDFQALVKVRSLAKEAISQLAPNKTLDPAITSFIHRGSSYDSFG